LSGSKYPKAFDKLATDRGSSTNAREGKPTGGPVGFHSGMHNEERDATNVLQETLGLEPQGDRDTVAERITAVEGLAEAGTGVDPTGLATVGGDGTVGGPGGSPLSASVVSVSGARTDRTFVKRTVGGKTIAQKDVVVNLRDWEGFSGAGTEGEDNSAEIQEAIDQAQAELVGTDTVPEVFIPGIARVSQTIELKSAPLRGAFPQLGAQILWDGSAGGTMLEKDTSFAGGLSKMHLSGLKLMPGEAEPGKYFVGGPLGIDDLGIFEYLWFGPCSSDAITLPTWTQANWNNIRWDDCKGYAIRLNNNREGATAFYFGLFDFEYAHNPASGGGPGFIYVENPFGKNIGQISLAHGRVEVDKPWEGPKAIVNYNNASTSNHSLKVNFDDVIYADSSGMTGDVLLHQEGTAKAPAVSIQGCELRGLSAILGGELPAGFPTFNSAADWEELLITQAGGLGTRTKTDATGNNMLEFRRSSSGVALVTYNADELKERFLLEYSGKMKWGPGGETEATDVILERITKGLKLTGRLELAEYLKLVPIAGSAAANVSLYVDSTSGKLMFKDASGTANALY
jgi:hypothetical protein